MGGWVCGVGWEGPGGARSQWAFWAFQGQARYFQDAGQPAYGGMHAATTCSCMRCCQQGRALAAHSWSGRPAGHAAALLLLRQQRVSGGLAIGAALEALPYRCSHCFATRANLQPLPTLAQAWRRGWWAPSSTPYWGPRCSSLAITYRQRRSPASPALAWRPSVAWPSWITTWSTLCPPPAQRCWRAWPACGSFPDHGLPGLPAQGLRARLHALV